LEETLGSRPILEKDVETIRAASSQIIVALKPLYPKSPSSLKIDDRELSNGNRVRIYTPLGVSQGLLPMSISYHSGGWSSGDLEGEHATCLHIAQKLPIIVVSANYRLGPEYKAPIALNDAVDALLWAYESANSFGGDRSKMIAAGGSAGGNLALAVTLRLLDKNIIAGVAALVPFTVHPDAVPTKYKANYKSYSESIDTPIINKRSMEIFQEAYGANPHDECFSVLLNSRMKEFPPTYLVSCGKDPLRDDAYLLKYELDSHGVRNKLDYYDGLPHYFWIFPQLSQTSQFLENLINGFRFILQ
ncbi:hypothetical protein OIDMADRAFT_139372, partial [Oidiodendron maius Zn]